MKRKILAMLAALAAMMAFGMAPASAADNVDRTSTCTIVSGVGNIHVRVHTNWDNTAGNNGAVLDYWSTKTDWGVSSQQFRVNYYTGGWSSWTNVDMSVPGPNWSGTINETYGGVTYVNKWVHQHGYDNRYSVEIKTIWGGYSCTVAMSPYWA